MALECTNLERVFCYKDTILSDPNPALSADEVLLFYSNHYPELTTSSIHSEISEEGKMVFTFQTTIGTKG
jgi:PRTRC genetic system protein C